MVTTTTSPRRTRCAAVRPFRSRADDPGAAVDPHHDRPAGAIAGRGGPHVEVEAVLALLVDQDAEDRGEGAAGLVRGGPEARRITHIAPRLWRFWRPESPRADGRLRERNAAEHPDVSFKGTAHPTPSRLDVQFFPLHLFSPFSESRHRERCRHRWPPSGGTTPSCCIRSSNVATPQCSVILPSTTRMASTV